MACTSRTLAKARTFYNDLLGFRVIDTAENIARRLPPGALKALEGEADPALFLYHGTDHHSFALFSERMRNVALMRGWQGRGRQTTVQQISWQIGSLAEMVNAVQYFRAREIPIQRTGRDMPGSNWHTYVWDPDDYINEFFYGMEQEGWNRRSKPYAMYYRGFTDVPSLPQMSEETELKEAFEQGVDVSTGYLSQDTLPPEYEVEGVILPRPFKVTKVGPAHIFVSDVDRSVRFYTDAFGFKVTEEAQYQGEKAVYLRAGSEHHSLGLISAGLKGRLGCRPDTSLMAFGLEVATYQQLKDAVGFLKENGVAFHLPHRSKPADPQK